MRVGGSGRGENWRSKHHVIGGNLHTGEIRLDGGSVDEGGGLVLQHVQWHLVLLPCVGPQGDPSQPLEVRVGEPLL